MKKFLSRLPQIVIILLNILFIALLFIKIYKDTAALPRYNLNGELIYYDRIDHFFSIFDRLAREGATALVYFSLALLIFSSLYSAATMIFQDNHEKILVGSYIIFGFSALLFFLLLLYTSNIHCIY